MDIYYLEGPHVTDLTSLQGMQLKWLWVYCTNVYDLTPLQGMPLERLWLTGSPVEDLTPLKGMPLQKLDIRYTPAAENPLPAWLPENCEVRI